MIVEESFATEKEVLRITSLFCGNHLKGKLSDRDITFEIQFKDLKHDEIIVSQLSSNPDSMKLGEFKMRPLQGEVTFGGNIYLFEGIPISDKAISVPDIIKAHPKRKATRIKIGGNPYISKMYAIISMKVVDFSVQDEEISKKIHLMITTIESHLIRSENYDIAKVSLFDGSEKNMITKIIKKYKKPFVVYDSGNFKIKEELTLSYEDYIKFLSEEGFDLKNILSQLDKVKEFYQKNKIKSEAVCPLVFEDEVIGQIRVVSLKENFSKSHVRRLQNLSQSSVEDLLDKCSFEVVTKEPQIIVDMSKGGAKMIITEKDMNEYIRLQKRIYIQIYFPDDTMIKTMGTILNIYDETPDGYKPIGIKFSANMDWREKNKIGEFIQSVIRLEHNNKPF